MSVEHEDDAAREVAAMQFAGGASIAQVAAEWERDAEWVEESIRRALLKTVRRRDGGLKAPRAEERERDFEAKKAARDAQPALEW